MDRWARVLERIVDSVPAADTASLLLELRATLTEETIVEASAPPGDVVVARRRGRAVRLLPTAAILRPGARATFTARPRDDGDGDDGAVTWTATGGTLTASGSRAAYVAASAPGAHTITATSVADPSRRATARIVIVDG
jgi:hypothetical protein